MNDSASACLFVSVRTCVRRVPSVTSVGLTHTPSGGQASRVYVHASGRRKSRVTFARISFVRGHAGGGRGKRVSPIAMVVGDMVVVF